MTPAIGVLADPAHRHHFGPWASSVGVLAVIPTPGATPLRLGRDILASLHKEPGSDMPTKGNRVWELVDAWLTGEQITRLIIDHADRLAPTTLQRLLDHTPDHGLGLVLADRSTEQLLAGRWPSAISTEEPSRPAPNAANTDEGEGEELAGDHELLAYGVLDFLAGCRRSVSGAVLGRLEADHARGVAFLTEHGDGVSLLHQPLELLSFGDRVCRRLRFLLSDAPDRLSARARLRGAQLALLARGKRLADPYDLDAHQDANQLDRHASRTLRRFSTPRAAAAAALVALSGLDAADLATVRRGDLDRQHLTFAGHTVSIPDHAAGIIGALLADPTITTDQLLVDTPSPRCVAALHRSLQAVEHETGLALTQQSWGRQHGLQLRTRTPTASSW